MVNPKSLANLRPPWTPLDAPRDQGRPSAGASIRDMINVYAAAGLSREQLREIAEDGKDFIRSAAALRALRMIEMGNISQFEPWLKGEKTMVELAAEGVNIDLVKKAKISDKGGREIELYDRSGADFDRVLDRTEGKAHQQTSVDLTENICIIDDMTRGR